MDEKELQEIKKRYTKEHIPLTICLGDGMFFGKHTYNIENTEGYLVSASMTYDEAEHFVDAVETVIPTLLAEIERLKAQNEIMKLAMSGAMELMTDMIGYVPDYFRAKWMHDEQLEEIKRLIREAGITE